MRVSILIPTLNRLALLKETLESARNQTYPDLEILVSDNGSVDRTREYVAEVSAVDARVRLLPARPSPDMFSNFNYLVDQSSGDAFCIVSDDDRLLPEYVDHLVRPLMADAGVVASFCDHWIISGTGERLAAATDENSRAYGRTSLAAGRVPDPMKIALAQTISVVFALYRASVFKREPFDLACGGAADVDYAIRAARAGGLYYVAERLAEYRAHAGTVTSTRSAFMIDGAIQAYAKHRLDQPAHEALRLARLRQAYAVKALFICSKDRAEWWDSVRGYRTSGGSLADPKILLSFAWAMLPKRASEALRAAAKAMRRRTENN
jgi:glycosyltransferase involved in cell wall biosynthesis